MAKKGSHVHHFVVESGAGAEATGKCKKRGCGEVRVFKQNAVVSFNREIYGNLLGLQHDDARKRLSVRDYNTGVN